MALTRAVAGALSHAELVDLVVRQSELIDQLQAVIAEQRTLIARLEARIRELEAERDRNDPTKRMPGLKPAATPRRRKSGPRKRRAHGFSRRGAVAPTEQVVHAAAVCPQCATRLSGGTERWRKEVLEVPPAPVRIIQHVYVERCCPTCGRRVVPPPARPAELGVLSGRQRLGLGLLAYLAVLRAELRLPVQLIQWALQALHGLELSQGAIVGALQRVAAVGQATAAEIRTTIRASPRVYADETGLRQDGTNGYLWSFSPERERYFVRGPRTKEMVDEVLGLDCAGVLVTDFYAAYDHYAGPHQRCWAHLLRDIHELTDKHPTDAALQTWATAVHGVYARACRAQRGPATRRPAAQRQAEADLLKPCTPYLAADAATVPQAVLCRRIQKYLPELFTFVVDPALSSTNNAAERSVRPVVCQRKISGGTRSPEGTHTFTTLATLFGTWRARGLDPLVACRSLLAQAAASV
jgi:transposase